MNKIFPLFIAAVLLLAGCGDPAGKVATESGTAPAIPTAPRPENSMLAVTQVGQCDFLSGMPAMITVSVRNVGDGNIDLPKWFVRDADNVIFHYIKCDENGNVPPDAKPSDWTVQTPVIKDPVYYPLTLMPGNSVLLRAELVFVSGLPPESPTAKYAVIAELNQSQVKLASPPVIITVFQ
ncbi:MAG: hypothetical protein PHI85_07245 [Victivallaceae bacterium]|nr:hypothetical protein [Victivallaceae bacterium]